MPLSVILNTNLVMRPILAALLLLAGLVGLLASCAGDGVPAPGVQALDARGGEEMWACFDSVALGSSRPIVILTRDGFGGEVRIGGKAHRALFDFDGLNRRWNFGLDLTRFTHPYAVIISPAGQGLYYDFTLEDRTKPRQLFRCRLTR